MRRWAARLGRLTVFVFGPYRKQTAVRSEAQKGRRRVRHRCAERYLGAEAQWLAVTLVTAWRNILAAGGKKQTQCHVDGDAFLGFEKK